MECAAINNKLCYLLLASFFFLLDITRKNSRKVMTDIIAKTVANPIVTVALLFGCVTLHNPSEMRINP